MSKKLQVAILCGGQSAEHDVSIMSAKNVVKALDVKKYDLLVIFINKNGEWYTIDSPLTFINATDIQALINTNHCQQVSLLFGENKSLITLAGKQHPFTIDVIFPVLHGAHGEDGTLQGLLELVNIPYVGPGVLSSAVCMDKEVSKRLLQSANLPTARWQTVMRHETKTLNTETIIAELGLPLFIKPANTGSSFGISKVKTAEQLMPAIELALEYDHKILIEEFIPCREIECAVLGNESPEASLPGEVIPADEFYTYHAKYFDDNLVLEVPARLSAETTRKLQALAITTYKILSCEGMTRVDFFVTQDEKIYINEANTIPGFTSASMYPKMWQASGVSYNALLDKLIALALARFERNRVLVAKKNNLVQVQANELSVSKNNAKG